MDQATDRKFWHRNFCSEECLCGREKRKRYAFCYRCFKALPDPLQGALYQKFYDGFEEAHLHLSTYVW